MAVADLSTTKTGLNEEVVRSLGTFARATTTVTNDTMVITVTFSPTGDQLGKTCDEIAVYDAATGGHLLFYGYPWLEPDGISGITVTTGDTMAYTIRFKARVGSF